MTKRMKVGMQRKKEKRRAMSRETWVEQGE
jgi:hypothetical protein